MSKARDEKRYTILAWTSDSPANYRSSNGRFAIRRNGGGWILTEEFPPESEMKFRFSTHPSLRAAKQTAQMLVGREEGDPRLNGPIFVRLTPPDPPAVSPGRSPGSGGSPTSEAT